MGQTARWQGVRVVADVDALQSQPHACSSAWSKTINALLHDNCIMPAAASLMMRTGSSKPSTSAAAIEPRICE